MYRHVIQVTDYMLIPDFLFLSGTILQYILRFLSQLMYLPTLNLLLSNRRPFYLSVFLRCVTGFLVESRSLVHCRKSD